MSITSKTIHITLASWSKLTSMNLYTAALMRRTLYCLYYVLPYSIVISIYNSCPTCLNIGKKTRMHSEHILTISKLVGLYPHIVIVMHFRNNAFYMYNAFFVCIAFLICASHAFPQFYKVIRKWIRQNRLYNHYQHLNLLL